MAAPSISWFRCTKSGPTYSAITSLNFGTVTAGAWSVEQCIRPKVATNSIQSAKWWFGDQEGLRSGAAVTVGSATWLHYMTITGTYVTVSATGPKGSANITAGGSAKWKSVPRTTGSGVAYSATSSGAYGDFVYFVIKVPSAAGDGAHTAWGYQLKYSYT